MLSDLIKESKLTEEELYKEQESKVGDYDNPDEGCPNCGRFRIMIGDDKKHRCEKCSWCIEENNYDLLFQAYQFGNL